MYIYVEVGRGLLGVSSNSCLADVLVDGWERAKPAAIDVTFTSPLTSATWVMLVNQQELQLMQQGVRSTLPMTQSVRSWGGSVFPLLLKHIALG